MNTCTLYKPAFREYYSLTLSTPQTTASQDAVCHLALALSPSVFVPTATSDTRSVTEH